MAETRWEDLRLRTNIPYTYCHQGDCEHTLIVRSIRCVHGKTLRVCCTSAVRGSSHTWIAPPHRFDPSRMLHPTDDQDRAAYPRLVFQARLRRPKCRICDLLPAKSVGA